jgi:hypothetical protein
VKRLALALALVAAAAGVARADAAKPAQAYTKMPGSARVFVLDKDAPPTEKTTPLPRLRPALKRKP